MKKNVPIYFPKTQVKKSDSCQYLQTAQYRASCKQRAMPLLDSWYRAEGWRGNGIVQPHSWDQVSASNRLRSNANTEIIQISVLACYRCPLPRQFRWTASSQVSFQSRASGRPCLCQHYASTPPVLQIILRYWRGTKPLVKFYLEIEKISIPKPKVVYLRPFLSSQPFPKLWK